MLIPFSFVIDYLIRSGYRAFTLDEFIDYYKEFFNPSLAVAEVIEDYDYLSVMTKETNKYDGFTVIFNDKTTLNRLVTTVETGKAFTIWELAQLHADIAIPNTVFYQIIEKEAAFQGLEPQSLMLQFDLYFDKIKAERDLSEKKIGRNEPCPCKSGLKYKNCHGK